MSKWVPEQPSPWRKSSKRESCYGDRVYASEIHKIMMGFSAARSAFRLRQVVVCFLSSEHFYFDSPLNGNLVPISLMNNDESFLFYIVVSNGAFVVLII